MRVAPLGAWFADDLDRAAAQAKLSAEVTHAHPEGQAGAIAVAVAAAWAAQWGQSGRRLKRTGLYDAVLALTPDGEVRDGLIAASQCGLDEWQHDVANQLGNGSRVTAQDTVPFCIWMAVVHLDNFVEAMWQTVGVGGDIDTNCAIIGGIIAAAVSPGELPPRWKKSREPLNW